MNIFAKGVMPITVKLESGETGINYTAQALTVRATEAAFKYARHDIGEYIRERYHYSDEGQRFILDNLTREAQIEFDILNDTEDVSSRLALVLVASDQGFTPINVLEWFFNEFDFFTECYNAAVELNPDLAPKEEVPNQAETQEAAEIKN